MSNVHICWIIPPYPSLLLKPGRQSPIADFVEPRGEVISYDGQTNFPHAAAIITTARKLQSALPDDRITCSILNLAAIPRSIYSDRSLIEGYVSKANSEIPFGLSTIEVRRLGVDIGAVANLTRLFEDVDIAVVSTSFETHLNEVRRIGRTLRSSVPVPLMASGKGVEGHENELLEAGFNLVFTGAVTDRGEEVLKALLENDEKKLSLIPGVHIDVNEKKVRNPAARGHSRPAGERKIYIEYWRNRAGLYDRFVPVKFRFPGRPDLACPIDADPAINYCCAMQDLPCEDLVSILPSGSRAVFAADEFFPLLGCPRTDCDFCHASGAGAVVRRPEYSHALLEFYRGIGATDLIPTDDQVLLRASSDIRAAGDLAEVYTHAASLGFSFLYGNGIEALALLRCVRKSQSGAREDRRVYGELMEAFLHTLQYIYLPYERLDAFLEPPRTRLAKLQKGQSGYMEVLQFLDDFAGTSRRLPLEVGTNIIFSETPEREEIFAYYRVMDGITGGYANLRIRFNGFFMIPSNCAPHITRYRRDYSLYSDNWPELKLVSIPTIMRPGESPSSLEQRLAWNIEARRNSKSRRVLSNGTYR